MNIKTIYIEITNKCNLNCHTCYNRSGLNKSINELSTKSIIQVINQFIPLGLKRVLLSGGEPTLHSEFSKILSLFSEYPNLTFGIVTNGTTNHQELIDTINTSNNLVLQVSLDGANEITNAKTRGDNQFSRVISLLSKIKNQNISPTLKMVVNQNNYHDVENFYILALKYNCIPEFSFIFKSGNAEDNWSNKEINTENKLKALNLIQKLDAKYNIKSYHPLCTYKCPYVDNLDNLSLCIKVDGTIQPCQLLYNNAFSLGNALMFNYIEFEKKLHDLSKTIQNRSHLDWGCQNCILKKACGRGCPAESFLLTGDILKTDNNCLLRKIQFLKHLM